MEHGFLKKPNVVNIGSVPRPVASTDILFNPYVSEISCQCLLQSWVLKHLCRREHWNGYFSWFSGKKMIPQKSSEESISQTSSFLLCIFHMGSGARLWTFMKARPTGCHLTCSLMGKRSAWTDWLEVMAFGLFYCFGLFDKAYLPQLYKWPNSKKKWRVKKTNEI